jgi:DedD protein
MAERIADNADLAVDELKRKARRRLVGAIVLALAAAVILPLLLEKEPKPLGDDVSVQIPPIDEGRFINRLTGRTGDAKGALKSDAKVLPKAATTKIDAASATIAAPVEAPPPSPAESPTPPTPALTPVPTNAVAPNKSIAEAERRILSLGAKPAPKSDASAAFEPKSDAKVQAEVAAPSPAASVTPPIPAPTASVTTPAAKGEGFAVQIAAFTDDKGANSLAGKLKNAGYDSTYTEPVETSRGTLWRVRVGGFASRADAEAARTKLKAEGWNGLVVATK